MSLKQRHTRSQRTTSVVSNTLIHPVTLFDFVMWQVVREHCAPAERRWPESRLQVPGVTHELPPVHRGVVDAVIFVLVCGALVMQGRGALLAWPSCEDPRGEEGWGHTGRKEGSKVAALHAQLPQIFHCTHLLVEHKLSDTPVHIQMTFCPTSMNQRDQKLLCSPPFELHNQQSCHRVLPVVRMLGCTQKAC